MVLEQLVVADAEHQAPQHSYNADRIVWVAEHAKQLRQRADFGGIPERTRPGDFGGHLQLLELGGVGAEVLLLPRQDQEVAGLAPPGIALGPDVAGDCGGVGGEDLLLVEAAGMRQRRHAAARLLRHGLQGLVLCLVLRRGRREDVFERGADPIADCRHRPP